MRAALDQQTWNRIRSRSVSNDLLNQLRTAGRGDLTAEISAQIRDTIGVDWKTLSSSSLAILMPWIERPDSPLIPELAANPSVIRAREIAQPFLTAKDLHGLASRAAELLKDPAAGSAELGMVVLSFANSLSADRRLDAALCHIVGKRLSYEDLVVLPWSVLVSIDLQLSHPEVRGDGPHKRCQRARERIDAAIGAAPLNDFFEVRKNTFRSASSMLIHAGRDPQKLASMGLDALLKTRWDKWWGRSKVALVSGPGTPGHLEFDFWPLILAGKGPTKVRIRLGKPEHFGRNGRTFYRVRSQFIDDGRSQFVGQTYWLLEPIQEADGQAGLFVHSAFDPGVRLGSNYQKYWQGASAVTFGKINLTPIFAQMHVWVEDSDGAEKFINGVNRGFHPYLAARNGWQPEGQSGSIKSGLPGLADYLVAIAQQTK